MCKQKEVSAHPLIPHTCISRSRRRWDSRSCGLSGDLLSNSKGGVKVLCIFYNKPLELLVKGDPKETHHCCADGLGAEQGEPSCGAWGLLSDWDHSSSVPLPSLQTLIPLPFSQGSGESEPRSCSSCVTPHASYHSCQGSFHELPSLTTFEPSMGTVRLPGDSLCSRSTCARGGLHGVCLHPALCSLPVVLLGQGGSSRQDRGETKVPVCSPVQSIWTPAHKAENLRWRLRAGLCLVPSAAASLHQDRCPLDGAGIPEGATSRS